MAAYCYAASPVFRAIARTLLKRMVHRQTEYLRRNESPRQIAEARFVCHRTRQKQATPAALGNTLRVLTSPSPSRMRATSETECPPHVRFEECNWPFPCNAVLRFYCSTIGDNAVKGCTCAKAAVSSKMAMQYLSTGLGHSHYYRPCVPQQWASSLMSSGQSRTCHKS